MSGEAKPAAELSAVNAEGVGIRARFYWTDDRFQHVIDLIRPEDEARILESIEGNPYPEWPASPPCQNLIEGKNENGEPAIMLTGSAGSCHWSVTAEVSQQEFPKELGFAFFGQPKPAVEKYPILLFDVACRLNSVPSWLGSSYGPVDANKCAEMGSFVYAQEWLLGPRIYCVNPDRPVLTCESTAKITASPGGKSTIQVRPPEHRIIRPPTTVRWTYGIYGHVRGRCV